MKKTKGNKNVGGDVGLGTDICHKCVNETLRRIFGVKVERTASKPHPLSVSVLSAKLEKCSGEGEQRQNALSGLSGPNSDLLFLVLTIRLQGESHKIFHAGVLKNSRCSYGGF